MKTNIDGRECAPWCIRDHQADDSGPTSCGGTDRRTGSSRAAARQYRWEASPEVETWLIGPRGVSTVSADAPYRAAELAQFIELAADAPEEDLRALAAHVRQAAAETWPEQEPEAGS
jgi:hypothetical protein